MHITLLIIVGVYLNRYWFAEPVYDFELKQYEFLSFLKNYRLGIDNKKIYPWLGIFKQIKLDMQLFWQRKQDNDILRRSDLRHMDLEKKSLIYDWEADVPEMKEVKTIIDYARPIVDESILELRALRQEVKSKIQCAPIGLISSKPQSGFILLNHDSGLHAYAYSKDLVLNDPLVSMKRISTYSNCPFPELTRIKQNLHSQYKHVSSHTWYVTGGESYPIAETLKPVVSGIIYELV